VERGLSRVEGVRCVICRSCWSPKVIAAVKAGSNGFDPARARGRFNEALDGLPTNVRRRDVFGSDVAHVKAETHRGPSSAQIL